MHQLQPPALFNLWFFMFEWCSLLCRYNGHQHWRACVLLVVSMCFSLRVNFLFIHPHVRSATSECWSLCDNVHSVDVRDDDIIWLLLLTMKKMMILIIFVKDWFNRRDFDLKEGIRHVGRCLIRWPQWLLYQIPPVTSITQIQRLRTNKIQGRSQRGAWEA